MSAGLGSRFWLPAPVSSFIGRERELADLRAELGRARLVTLTGAGGVGKTRLALEVARRRAARSGVPAAFVELASASRRGAVVVLVAEALGLRSVEPALAEEAVVGRLAGVSLLLVLDNCERVAGACGELAWRVLSRCPGARVLATSRQPLGVPGEVVWAVAPLGLDEARRLFLARAREARPSLAPDTSWEEAVMGICRRLEGIPLALELAAAQVSVLSPSEILPLLEDRLALPAAAPGRLGPARQRTVRASIGWSFELLDAGERSAFARLAVFTGAFSRDGAHAVAEANTQVLAALTAKSMIHPVASRGGATRYRMLETVQAFALEQLADAAKPVRERHLEWWISRAERSCGRGLVPVSRAAFDAVYQDIDDLRSALRFAIEHAPRKGLRLIATTRDVWHKAAQSEGLERALRLLEVCPEQDADRGWGLVAGGRLAMVAQDHELAQRLLGEAVAIARREREPRLEALARWLLGISLALSQRLDESELMARSALDLFRAQSDEAGEGRSTSLLGFVAVLRGDLAAAPELLEQALAILTAAGDVFGSGHCHWYLALLKRAAGDLRAAEGHLREAIELLSSDRDVAILGMALAALAQIEVKRAPRRALVIAAAAAARHRVGGRYGLFGGDDIEHVRAAAISALGPGKAEQAWREGSRLLFDEAATLALRQTAPRRSGDRGGLSRREFEVAELVASGLTNAEVAATLHLAQRTVENHVAHALAKLGLRNRTELAARLGELAPS